MAQEVAESGEVLGAGSGYPVALSPVPFLIQPMIDTTNSIERTRKEIKKTHQNDEQPAQRKSGREIVYLQSNDYNQRWAERKLRGFSTASPGSSAYV